MYWSVSNKVSVLERTLSSSINCSRADTQGKKEGDREEEGEGRGLNGDSPKGDDDGRLEDLKEEKRGTDGEETGEANVTHGLLSGAAV